MAHSSVQLSSSRFYDRAMPRGLGRSLKMKDISVPLPASRGRPSSAATECS